MMPKSEKARATDEPFLRQCCRREEECVISMPLNEPKRIGRHVAIFVAALLLTLLFSATARAQVIKGQIESVGICGSG